MRLSAFDCAARGISNLRGNWELVLLQLAQMVVFFVLTVASVVALAAAMGATFLLQIASVADWNDALGRLSSLEVDTGLVAIAGVAILIVATLGSLVWGWFQAGIFSTLEHGERQAPPSPKTDWSVFRTFGWRNFMGWGNRGTWRYFLFLGWFFLVSMVVLALVLLVAVALALAAPRLGTGATLAAGCAAVVPVLGLMLALNLWLVVAQALLPRPDQGVLRASWSALAVLRRRAGAALLLLLLFLFASLGASIVFWPLSQGMAMAVDGAGPALVVELLLGIAQMLVASILSIAFYGSIVALARNDLSRPAA